MNEKLMRGGSKELVLCLSAVLACACSSKDEAPSATGGTSSSNMSSVGGAGNDGDDTPPSPAGNGGISNSSGEWATECAGYDEWLADPPTDPQVSVCYPGDIHFVDGADDGSGRSATTCWIYNRRPCTTPPCTEQAYDELIACARGELVPPTCSNCGDNEVLDSLIQRTCAGRVRVSWQWCQQYADTLFDCPEDVCQP